MDPPLPFLLTEIIFPGLTFFLLALLTFLQLDNVSGDGCQLYLLPGFRPKDRTDARFWFPPFSLICCLHGACLVRVVFIPYWTGLKREPNTLCGAGWWNPAMAVAFKVGSCCFEDVTSVDIHYTFLYTWRRRQLLFQKYWILTVCTGQCLQCLYLCICTLLFIYLSQQ